MKKLLLVLWACTMVGTAWAGSDVPRSAQHDRMANLARCCHCVREVNGRIVASGTVCTHGVNVEQRCREAGGTYCKHYWAQ